MTKAKKKSVTAIVLPAEGDAYVNNEFIPGLSELQEVVGGYIEVVAIPAHARKRIEERFNLKLSRGAQLIVNEEGMLMNLPVNQLVSELIGYDCIVGDAIITQI